MYSAMTHSLLIYDEGMLDLNNISKSVVNNLLGFPTKDSPDPVLMLVSVSAPPPHIDMHHPLSYINSNATNS